MNTEPESANREAGVQGERHSLELLWGTDWWTILDAIAAAPDLSQRGVRGLLAEHEFHNRILAKLPAPWKAGRAQEKKHGEGTGSVDWMISKGEHSFSIQVKMQRLSKGAVIIENGQGLVETQKTRTRGKTKERRYEYGEFDILAVSLWPVTRNWKDFMYIPDDCLPHAKGKRNLIAPFHPVPLKRAPAYYWTDSIEEVFEYAKQFSKSNIVDSQPPVVQNGSTQ